ALIAAVLVACWAPQIVTSATAFFISPDSDPAQHLIGAKYFFADVWRWPLLDLPDLGTPQGSNLTMTDSIPLAALLTKLLKPVLPHWPNTFGPWLLLCFTLQAAGFAAIARALGVRERWAIIGIGLLGLATPIVLFRTAHIALCSQFLLLFPLAAYWRYSRQPVTPLPFLAMAAWLAVGLLIHPYLAAMQLSIALALLGTGLWQQRLATRHAIGALIGWLGMLLVMGWICGNAGVALPWGSYGVAPLNLAGPWWPQLSGLLAPDRLIDPTGYHYDAYNYWGAGFLFAILAAAIVGVRWFLTRLAQPDDANGRPAVSVHRSRHAPLLIVLWLLTVYAIGYDVYFLASPVAGVRAADVMASFNREDGLGTILILLREHRFDLALLAVMQMLPVLIFIAHAWRERRFDLLRFVAFLLLAITALLLIAPDRSLRTLSNFAASGRFFWVVTYALIPTAIVFCYRHLPRRGFGLLLIGVIALQFADMRPLFERQRMQFAVSNPMLPSFAELEPLIAKAQRVDIQPRFGCVKNHYTELKNSDWARLSSTYMALHWMIAQRTLPTNSVYQARADDRAACDTIYVNGLPTPLGGGAVTIYLEVPGFPPVATSPASISPNCRRISSAVVCP
ncbi:MAG: DUF6311 domain-containing protein, partial [Dokdonella sp.]